MNKIGIRIMQGLLALVPVTLTLYLLFWLISSVEMLLIPFIPAPYYVPGMGFGLGVVLLIFIGIVVNAYAVKMVVTWSGHLLEQIPVVKTVYGTINDAINLINIGKGRQLETVVSVSLIEGVQLIGFVTVQDGEDTVLADSEKVAVYIPLSYQIGGYTLYIDRCKIEPLDVDVETAMRIALTGGSASKTCSEPASMEAQTKVKIT